MTQALNVTGIVEKRVYNTSRVEDTYPNWSTYSGQRRAECLDTIEPESVERVENVTTTRFHEYFVDNLDPNDTSNDANTVISWMALGDDGKDSNDNPDTDPGHEDLNSRRFESQVDDVTTSGRDITATMTMGPGDGNISNDYNEIGLFNGDPNNVSNSEIFMMNHAAFDGVNKNSDKTLSFDVTLSFSN